MKWIIFFILTVLSFVALSQIEPTIVNGTAFNSVFQSMKSGSYMGTVNGILILENKSRKTILDFQGSDAELLIEADSFEVYDVSTKIYKGATTSGRTEVQYRTYGRANAIRVYILNNWYELSFIDGACYEVIDGLEYQYEVENTIEYLVLVVTKELVLNNWQHIIKTEYTMDPDNIEQLKPKKSEIKILPNSTLVFAITRK
jgi:hypothetical protein